MAGDTWCKASAEDATSRRVAPVRRLGYLPDRPLVAQERADPADRLEVVPVREARDCSSVGESLVDRQVESVRAHLHRSAVERTGPLGDGDPAALRAPGGAVARPFLVEQAIDATVGGSLERSFPSRGRPSAPPCFFPPALDDRVLTAGTPALENGGRRRQEFGGARMRLRPGPAHDCPPDVVGQEIRELGLCLLVADDDDRLALEAAKLPVELLGDRPQVFVREAVDVALGACLRPATLVVPARLVVRSVDDFLEPAVVQTVDVAALAADRGNENALTAPDERNERREVELAVHADIVGDRLSQPERPPELVESGTEDGQPADALAAELLLVIPANPLEVIAQALPLIVPEALGGERPPARLVEERVHSTRRIPRGRRRPRIEVEVEADSAALLAAE